MSAKHTNIYQALLNKSSTQNFLSDYYIHLLHICSFSIYNITATGNSEILPSFSSIRQI